MPPAWPVEADLAKDDAYRCVRSDMKAILIVWLVGGLSPQTQNRSEWNAMRSSTGWGSNAHFAGVTHPRSYFRMCPLQTVSDSQKPLLL